jgi:uncharacterized RDD family membrane protein YckC
MEEQQSHLSVIYGGFLRRFAALIVDVLIFLAFYLPTFFLFRFGFPSKTGYVIVEIFGLLFGQTYVLFFNSMYGATLGKMALGLKILKVDFTPIGFKQAFLRNLPDLLLQSIRQITMAIGIIMFVEDSTFGAGVSFMAITEMINTQLEGLSVNLVLGGAQVVQFLYLASEIICFLMNSKNRAVHDLIAGTVVVRMENDEILKEEAQEEELPEPYQSSNE